MPIYMRVDGIEGRVTPGGRPGGGPKVTVFNGVDRGGLVPGEAVEISRVSLSPSGDGVEGRDPGARFKIEQIFESASSSRTRVKIFLCPSDSSPGSPGFGGQGRLLAGTDHGVWRTGAANKLRHTNNLRQLGLAAHNVHVEIFITDANRRVLRTFRLEDATVSRHPGGMQALLCDGSVKF